MNVIVKFDGICFKRGFEVHNNFFFPILDVWCDLLYLATRLRDVKKYIQDLVGHAEDCCEFSGFIPSCINILEVM